MERVTSPRSRGSRIIICGGRHFDDYETLEKVVDKVISELKLTSQEIEIVSGNCQGTDLLGELYAEKHELKCTVFPAKWKKFGKAAGPIRNSEMIDYISDSENPIVIAFVSPNSKGTMDTVNKAVKAGFTVYKIEYVMEEGKARIVSSARIGNSGEEELWVLSDVTN